MRPQEDALVGNAELYEVSYRLKVSPCRATVTSALHATFIAKILAMNVAWSADVTVPGLRTNRYSGNDPGSPAHPSRAS